MQTETLSSCFFIHIYYMYLLHSMLHSLKNLIIERVESVP